jgi:hypothetical protein
MVAVTLPVQQAWTRLQVRGSRHQSGKGDTRLGLRPFHRGKCQEEEGGSRASKKPELNMSCSQEF